MSARSASLRFFAGSRSLLLPLAGLALSAPAAAAPVQAVIEADLAVGYAPSYATSVGGDDNVEVILANAVVGSNRINEISGTGASMRIVGFIRSANDPLNATTTGGIVGWLANNDSRVSDVVAFGTATGADLVTYIVQNSDSANIAAVAQQPGMYSAYNPSSVWSAIFAHETGGHNYGRSHSDGVPSPKTVMLHNYCTTPSGGATPPYYYSNPNMVFNGVRLLGTSDNNCGMGSLVNGGDNSAPSAQAVADRRERIITGPRLGNVMRRWLFTQAAGSAPAGTAVADSVSGASAVVRGVGATFTGSALRIPGTTTGNVAANSIAAYVDLPNGLLSSRSSVTIELWATPLSAPNWGRILDFGRATQAGDGLGAAGEYTGTPGSAAPGSTSSSDGIMLSASIGTDISTQRFEAKLDGNAVTLDAGLPTIAGVQHHYAITYTPGVGDFAGSGGGRWEWYRDGDPVAYLDVNYALSSLEDVNNWLGRSAWSADNMANVDYAEVRVSDVALSRGEVLANYRLGPAYAAPAQVTLAASDATGASSFNTAGSWSDATTPSAAQTYETFAQTLRTPTTGFAYTFAGSGLRLSGGRLLYKGPGSGIITVTGLVLNAGTVTNGSSAYTLAGSLSATAAGGVFNNVNAALTLSASLSGSGPLTHLGNPTTLTGNNTAFTGRTYVGNGSSGTLSIDAKSRLGATPATTVADQLVLNRGVLATTATFALDEPTRGIRLDVSGGTFNVASGTTLTVTSPVSTPAPSGGAYPGSLTKSGAGTLVLAAANSAFQGLVYVDTSSTTDAAGNLRIAHPQALSNARSPIYIRNNNAGTSTLQLDGVSGNITQSQRLWLSGRTNTTPAVQNITGTNSLGGITVDVGGGNYLFQSDAGTLRLTGNLTAAATGTRTFTLQGTGDFELAGTVINGNATVALVKSGSGTLLLSSSAAHTGGTTVGGGTLRLSSIGGLPSGTLVVSSGATLSGIGSVGAAATINGTHTPGFFTGVQTFTGALTYSAGSRLRWTLSSNTADTAFTGRVSAGTVTVASAALLDLKLDPTGATTDYFSAFWTQSRSWTALAATTQSGTFTLGTVSGDSFGRAASTYGAFALAQSVSGTTVQWTPRPYAAWRGTSFATQAGTSAVADFNADPDGDGLQNGLEYFVGTDPAVAGASPIAPQLVDGRLRLVFPRRITATDVIATVQGTDSLDGPWTDLARSTSGAAFAVLVDGVSTAETGEGDLRTVEVNDAYPADAVHPRRFLRLVIAQAAP